jgi:glutamate carboxypeptidase
MPLDKKLFEWINAQSPEILTFVKELSSINSWSYNQEGLEVCYTYLIENCPIKDITVERIPCKNTASALKITKKNRIKTDKNYLFCIHIDTVYPPENTVPVTETDDYLIGPGVADAKGGIAVLLWTILALEKATLPPFNWTILINPDEEIGSNASKDLLVQEAKTHNFGFVFEPTLPNGNMVSERKGSYNGELVSTGVSAHAGRHIEQGVNAITPLCALISDIIDFCKTIPTLSVNIGTIHGGTAINQVPDQAKAAFNLRSPNKKDIDTVLHFIKTTINHSKSAATLLLKDLSYRPPKVLSKDLQRCIDSYSAAAKELSQTIQFEATGGVCDGNILQDCGLPTLDTLGPVGEFLHSPKERVLKASFCERIQLNTTYISKNFNVFTQQQQRHHHQEGHKE